MNSNQWQWLIDHCRTNGIRFLPGESGEPWVPYSIVAEFVQQEERTIAQNASEWKIPRHPAFTGLIQITSFERIQSRGKHGGR